METSDSSLSTIRNFIFGVEDSLVSTVGLVAGVTVAGVSTEIIVLTGLILVLVEAFSMSAGSLLTENTLREIRSQHLALLSASAKPALIMFFAYAFSGVLVLVPYLFLPPAQALPLSAAISLGALFVLGLIVGELSHTSRIRNGFTMVVVGGLAIAVGVGAGTLLQNLTGYFA